MKSPALVLKEYHRNLEDQRCLVATSMDVTVGAVHRLRTL